MLLLTIALATMQRESEEGDIENYLRETPEAMMGLRKLLWTELTKYFIANGVILEDEIIVVPFLTLTNVEGFGAHD